MDSQKSEKQYRASLATERAAWVALDLAQSHAVTSRLQDWQSAVQQVRGARTAFLLDRSAPPPAALPPKMEPAAMRRMLQREVRQATLRRREAQAVLDSAPEAASDTASDTFRAWLEAVRSEQDARAALWLFRKELV